MLASGQRRERVRGGKRASPTAVECKEAEEGGRQGQRPARKRKGQRSGVEEADVGGAAAQREEGAARRRRRRPLQ